MTLDEMKFWFMVGFQAVNGIASAGLWLYVRYGDRNKEIDKKFAGVAEHIDHQVEKLRDELDEHRGAEGQRLGALEVAIARAPTHQDLAALHEKMNATSSQVSQMAGELKGVNDNLRLILSRIAEMGLK